MELRGDRAYLCLNAKMSHKTGNFNPDIPPLSLNLAFELVSSLEIGCSDAIAVLGNALARLAGSLDRDSGERFCLDRVRLDKCSVSSEVSWQPLSL